jgi:hypothetical protein
MKINKWLLVALYFATSLIAFAQTGPYSLDHIKYFENPHQYLSGLDLSNVGTGPLVDRYLHNGNVFKTNGINNVTTIDYSDYYDIYQTIKYSHIDTASLLDFKKMVSISEELYENESVNLISMLDFSFKSIDSLAVKRGDLVQTNEGLSDKAANSDSFKNNRVVAFSCFKYNLYGDKIDFFIPEGSLLTNHDSLEVTSIQIDFGNGEGYKTVITGSPMTIIYSAGSEYIEMKLKIKYQNKDTYHQSEVFAHTSVYRKTENIPRGKRIQDYQSLLQLGDNTERSGIVSDVVQFFYPEKSTITTLEFVCLVQVEFYCVTGGYFPAYEEIAEPYTFDVTIVYNSKNKSNKLRKPFVMVDGFDPGNKRNYFETVKSDPQSNLLEKEKDLRGLYEILDGQHSPWDLLDDYDNSKNPINSEPEMVNALRAEGFDLVFVNFEDGAGDINGNAGALRRFLNEVLNSNVFRDNKTEEIVLVGPSMGGLITRIALAEMEKAGEEHFVKSWISFDSPHTGANIPVGLQHAMNKMSKSNLPPVRDGGNKAMTSVNSATARQLFKHHYESTSQGGLDSDPMHKELMQKLNDLAYPKMSKNYSITNGTTGLLYSNSISNIGSVHLSPSVIDGYIWTQSSPVISQIKVKGMDREVIAVGNLNKLKIENAPGGWFGALYSFNKNRNNDFADQMKGAGDHFDKSVFIPTSSSFGIALNTNTVQKNWTDYTSLNQGVVGSKTIVPFDEILGMYGENQEHISITPSTKDNVIQWVVNDFEEASRPYHRADASGTWSFANEATNQTASKPVAYLVQNKISFGGNDNTFQFKEGSDAKVVSGETIEFLVGFSTSQGAKMEAKIQKMPRGGILRKGYVKDPKKDMGVPFTTQSVHKDKVYDYSIASYPSQIQQYEVDIGPNPVDDQLHVNVITNNTESDSWVEVRSVSGELMVSSIMSGVSLVVDFSTVARGVYIVTVTNEGKTVHKKVLKL